MIYRGHEIEIVRITDGLGSEWHFSVDGDRKPNLCTGHDDAWSCARQWVDKMTTATTYVNTHQLSVMARCKPARINRLVQLNKIKPDAFGKWGAKTIPLWEEENAWSLAHQIQTIRELKEEFAL